MFKKVVAAVAAKRIQTHFLILTCLLLGLVACSMPKPGDKGTIDPSIDVSENGRYLVFTGESARGNNLFLLDLSSSKVAELTNNSDYEDYPAFSPDGASIVFIRAVRLGSPQYLFILNLKSKKITQLTSGKRTADSFPRYSLDGKCIVFERDFTLNSKTPFFPWHDAEVYVINTDGSKIHALTTPPIDTFLHPSLATSTGPGYFLTQVNNPDFTCYVKIEKLQIDQKRGTVAVTDTGLLGGYPYLFDGGRKLAFTHDHNGDCIYNIYIADLKSRSAPVCIHAYRNGFSLSSPVVSENGHIYFLDGYYSGLWEVDLDGKHEHLIADGSLFSNPLQWRPR